MVTNPDEKKHIYFKRFDTHHKNLFNLPLLLVIQHCSSAVRQRDQFALRMFFLVARICHSDSDSIHIHLPAGNEPGPNSDQASGGKISSAGY